MRCKMLVAALVLASAATVRAEDGLSKGTPDLKSATALAFGPKGLLFVGDSAGAAVFAIDTGDTKPAGDKPLNVDKLNAKIAAALGVSDKDVKINDVRVNPASGNVFVGVSRGTGAGTPALVKVARDGTVSAVALKDVRFSKVAIPNPATSGKGAPEVITQLAFVDGKVIVAGLSSEQFASTLRVIPFPFKEADKGAGIEIFHGAHGALETKSPIRTFVAYKVGKEDHIMAAYTCTPLVKIPVSDLKAGAKVKGTTIAELGNGNRPLDMIVYTKGGKDYLLMANSKHGVLKLPTTDFATATPITARTGPAGIKAEAIKELADVMQLDKLDDGHALLLLKSGDLKTVPLP
ncbi:MAG TPA: hypothetical protein VGE74_27150 [Gemmata sp.]